MEEIPRIHKNIKLKRSERKKLKNRGYVVIENYISKRKANKLAVDAVNFIIDNYPDVTEDYDTWTDDKVPYQRGNRGIIQWGGIPQCRTAWKCRELMYPLFSELYDDEDLATSLDGATVCPPLEHFTTTDWPHLDQLTEGLQCIQGQIVLTDTHASFCCTRYSNRCHEYIVDKYVPEEKRKNKFYKFEDEQIKKLKREFRDRWQNRITVPAGSVILWDSRTIHSSKLQPSKYRVSDGIFDGENLDEWRVVFYVCMRPKYEYSNRNKNTLRNGVDQGRGTNHWGTNIFPYYNFHDRWKYSEETMEILKDPPRYSKLNSLMKSLVFLD